MSTLQISPTVSYSQSNALHYGSSQQPQPLSPPFTSPDRMDFAGDRSPSPPDSRTKNARAQARHRAKRKAYIENLENTVRQLRSAVSQGLTPQAQAQTQLLERENARLRAEAQYLRAQLNSLGEPATGPLSSSWTPAQNTEAAMRVIGSVNMAGSSSQPQLASGNYGSSSRSTKANAPDTFRASQRSPEIRRDRATTSAPYLVDSMRRASLRPQDYSYPLQNVDTAGGSSSQGTSLLSSPYQTSTSSSSSAVGDLYDTSYAAFPYSGPSSSTSNQASSSTASGTVYSNPPLAAPQSSYPPMSSYTASLYGLSAHHNSDEHEDVKPAVHDDRQQS